MIKIKITNSHKKKLECICGICQHDAYDKTCLWNKIIDADDVGVEEYKQIMAIMSDVVKMNIELRNNAKIAPKEVKCQKKKPTSKKLAK